MIVLYHKYQQKPGVVHKFCLGHKLFHRMFSNETFYMDHQSILKVWLLNEYNLSLAKTKKMK